MKSITDRLNYRRKNFVNNFIKNGGNATKAVKESGYNPGGKGGKDPDASARAIGSELLSLKEIQDYFELLASGAAQRVEDLSITARSEVVRLQANKDILDRAGLKVGDKIDLTTKGDKLYTNEQIQRAAAEIIHRRGETDNGDTSEE